MSAANYCPVHIPITGGTLTIWPHGTGPVGEVCIDIVNQAGGQTVLIDASYLDMLQEQICILLAAIDYVAVG